MSQKGLNQYEHQLLREQPLNLVPYPDEFSEKRTVSGLIIPMGTEFNKVMLRKDVSGVVLGLWRKHLKARVFHVSGEMIFKADLETYYETPRSDEDQEIWGKYGGGES